MVADNEPFLAVAAVGETEAGPHLCACFREGERVDAGIHGHVGAGLYLPHVDFPDGLVFEKVREIVRFLLRGQSGFVGDGGQEDGLFGVVGDNIPGTAGLKGFVPPIKEGGDFLFAGRGHDSRGLVWPGGAGSAGGASVDGEGRNGDKDV